MVRGKIAALSFGMSVACSTMAFAVEEQKLEVPMPNIGFMYKFELRHHDDGLKKDAEQDAATTKFGLDVFRMLVDGKVTNDLEYNLRLKLDPSNAAILDYGYLKWNWTESQSVIFGKAKARVYGWEQRGAGPLSVVNSLGYTIDSPFKYVNMVGLESRYGWGNVTVQFAEDKLPACAPTGLACPGWNTINSTNNTEINHKQPAAIVEYTGNFAGFQPLLQYGVYDLGHSSIYTAGIRYSQDDTFNVEVDYTNHNIGTKDIKTGETKFSDLVHTVTNIALNASMKAGSWAPFLHYSSYDFAEHNDSATAPKISVNRGTAKFDDNGTVMALGADYVGRGNALVPYAAVVQNSGKFTDKNGKEATMAEMEVKLGVKGAF